MFIRNLNVLYVKAILQSSSSNVFLVQLRPSTFTFSSICAGSLEIERVKFLFGYLENGD